jgi:hypothetical protein
VQQFFELLKLFFCLLVINALTLKLRLKATFLRLQNRYLAFRLRETIKRKQNTLTKYLRDRNVLKGVSGNFDHSHHTDLT